MIPMYTYTWTVTGGTPASITGNPNVIQWGSGSTGFIKVVISNIPSGGTCVDSVFMQICLIDGPQADSLCHPTQFARTHLLLLPIPHWAEATISGILEMEPLFLLHLPILQLHSYSFPGLIRLYLKLPIWEPGSMGCQRTAAKRNTSSLRLQRYNFTNKL